MYQEREPLIEALLASRRDLRTEITLAHAQDEAEGGCGVIGMAASVPVHGNHLLQSLRQMRNRGNGKGGGIAAAGLDPAFFGCDPSLLVNNYLLAVAYLDGQARQQVEASCIEPAFLIDKVFHLPSLADFHAIPGLTVSPPDVWCYFVRVRPEVLARFREEHEIPHGTDTAIEDEVVYQNSYRLNRQFYAATGEKRAFVLSHGKNMLVLKLVGYGDDVVRYYQLENLGAHVWIGHHRYPTKGKVWHPGGAHPFIGMHEALVHNGDFANYAAICSYLAQRNIQPLFLTDTEVAVLEFDLLHRVYGYPLEYVIEAMAPTTERDFALLPVAKQRLYRAIQAVHLHSSPDGPWFFLIAQSNARERVYRLIGITDTSMLRPQVFALQCGKVSIGFAASEKQAIDAALESLANEDARFWSRADLYWNARGGSHTDGGAFVFTVQSGESGETVLNCVDKFGRAIETAPAKHPLNEAVSGVQAALQAAARPRAPISPESTARALFERLRQCLPSWDYEDVQSWLAELLRTAGSDDERERAIEVLTLLMDRRYSIGTMKRSCLVALVDRAFARLLEDIRVSGSQRYLWCGAECSLPECQDESATVLLDARGYPAEGENSLARIIVELYQRGFRRLIVAHARGHRFIGCGLGGCAEGLRIDVYGSPGDYLASGIDGAEVIVHGSAQDQLAQIMKGGRLVVYGDVGQTFMYAAKGGQAFLLGDAAGRPLINAVGGPRVVINGTCLDYLAESFMAGDPLNGGGFVIVNGMRFDEGGALRELETPYPGGNLFSLASAGAIYIRDPRQRLTEDQLNGGEFAPLTAEDWELILPYLRENEALFDISIERLLSVDGSVRSPAQVYRKIRPGAQKALMPEEAWVHRKNA